MILTVTLNAAVDRTVAVPNFRQGHRHRAVETRTVAGGKGINVARAIARLGRPVIASGLAGGPTGARLLEQLADEGILTDFTMVSAESRVNLAVVDPTTGEQTEINERGPEVSTAELESFVDRLDYLARGISICVLAGSLPPGADSDLYARLVKRLNDAGVSVILDAEGAPMTAALRAGPGLIAPNVREAEELIGHEFDGPIEMARGISELLDLGAGEAIITRPDGCVAAVGLGSERSFLEVSIDPLEPVSAVGSGDAFLAGFVSARYDGRPPSECLAFGVACGAESTQHFGAGAVDPDQANRLLERVRVRELVVPVA